jgi:hypothetical protein
MGPDPQVEKEAYYKAFDVWARLDEGRLARYRCLQIIPGGKFCVQSKDFYNPPFAETAAEQLERQFLELLSEELPSERSGMYGTIEEAIRAHDGEF